MSVIVTVELSSGIHNSPIRSNSFFRWINQGQKLVIGRSGQVSDMVVPDDQLVSSQHFEIESHGNSCTVRDLESTNGTFIDEQPIQEVNLTADGYVVAGKTKFHIHLPTGRGVVADQNEDAVIDSGSSQGSLPATVAEKPIRQDRGKSEEASEETLLNVGREEFLANGWGIELASWPAPMSSEVRDEVFENHASHQAGFEQLSIVLMIHEGSDGAWDRMVSRPVAWISNDQKIIVGRSATESDWAISADQYLSGKHFRISNEGGKCLLENLSKTNGTWVNNEQFETILLRDQDLIRAGETVFQVGIEGGEALSDQEVRISAVKAK